jgi:hypothetical protein
MFHQEFLQISNANQQQSCVPQHFAHFSLWVVLKCLGKFWGTCKVLEWHQGVKGMKGVLS